MEDDFFQILSHIIMHVTAYHIAGFLTYLNFVNFADVDGLWEDSSAG